MLAEPPSAQDGEALDALRRALESAHFTVKGIEERLGTNELSLRPIDTAVISGASTTTGSGRLQSCSCSARRPR